jgi:hypothetical protein
MSEEHRMWKVTPWGTNSDALQQAIDQAGQCFGTVQLQPTEYVLDKPIRIDRPIRLIGAGWRPTWEDDQPNGTWLRLGKRDLYKDAENYDRRCAVTVAAAGSEVSNIAFRQIHPFDGNPGDWGGFAPEPDVAALYVPASDVLLSNLFLYNVTHGILAINAGRIDCQRIRGFPLGTAIEMDHILDVARVTNVHLWPFWPTPRPGFDSEHPDPRVVNVGNYVMKNGIGLLSFRNDNPQILSFFVLGYGTGMSFKRSPRKLPDNRGVQRSWGTTERFHLTSVEFDHCAVGIEMINDRQRGDPDDHPYVISGQAANLKGMGNGQWSISGLYARSNVDHPVSIQACNVQFAEYGQCGVNGQGAATNLSFCNFWLESWNLQGTIVPPPLPACPGVNALRGHITFETIMEDYRITIEDIRACIAFASSEISQHSYHPLTT